MLTAYLEADFFIILFNAILSNPEKVGHGRDGYYFGENGDFLWYDVVGCKYPLGTKFVPIVRTTCQNQNFYLSEPEVVGFEHAE